MKMKSLDKTVNNPIEIALTKSRNESPENYWLVENLPTHGKFYPPGTKIFARPLKTLELKQLTSINENNVDFIINNILERATKGIEVDELLVADKLYILFWIRANTFKESGFTVSFDCKLCKKPSEYEFNIDCLEIKEYDDTIDYNRELILPQSKKSVKVEFKKVKDENRVSQFLSKHKNSLMSFDEDILNIANSICEVEGVESRSLLNNYEFLIDLSAIDFSYIVSWIDYIDIGVSTMLNVKCRKCGGDTHVGVSFRPDFFVPTYKFK